MPAKHYKIHSKMTIYNSTKCTLIMHNRSKIILSQVRSISVIVLTPTNATFRVFSTKTLVGMSAVEEKHAKSDDLHNCGTLCNSKLHHDESAWRPWKFFIGASESEPSPLVDSTVENVCVI